MPERPVRPASAFAVGKSTATRPPSGKGLPELVPQRQLTQTPQIKGTNIPTSSPPPASPSVATPSKKMTIPTHSTAEVLSALKVPRDEVHSELSWHGFALSLSPAVRPYLSRPSSALGNSVQRQQDRTPSPPVSRRMEVTEKDLQESVRRRVESRTTSPSPPRRRPSLNSTVGTTSSTQSLAVGLSSTASTSKDSPLKSRKESHSGIKLAQHQQQQQPRGRVSFVDRSKIYGRHGLETHFLKRSNADEPQNLLRKAQAVLAAQEEPLLFETPGAIQTVDSTLTDMRTVSHRINGLVEAVSLDSKPKGHGELTIGDMTVDTEVYPTDPQERKIVELRKIISLMEADITIQKDAMSRLEQQLNRKDKEIEVLTSVIEELENELDEAKDGSQSFIEHQRSGAQDDYNANASLRGWARHSAPFAPSEDTDPFVLSSRRSSMAPGQRRSTMGRSRISMAAPSGSGVTAGAGFGLVRRRSSASLIPMEYAGQPNSLLNSFSLQSLKHLDACRALEQPCWDKAPQGQVTYLCVRIQSGERLVQAHGGVIGKAVSLYLALADRCVARHGGHTVVGDMDQHFAAFGDPLAAAACALDLQRELVDQPWPSGTALDDDLDFVAVRDEGSSQWLWRGLRARCAIYYSHQAESQRDLLTGKMEYYGDSVRHAIFLEEHTFGGLIIFDENLYDLYSTHLVELEDPIITFHSWLMYPGETNPRRTWRLVHRKQAARSADFDAAMRRQHIPLLYRTIVNKDEVPTKDGTLNSFKAGRFDPLDEDLASTRIGNELNTPAGGESKPEGGGDPFPDDQGTTSILGAEGLDEGDEMAPTEKATLGGDETSNQVTGSTPPNASQPQESDESQPSLMPTTSTVLLAADNAVSEWLAGRPAHPSDFIRNMPSGDQCLVFIQLVDFEKMCSVVDEGVVMNYLKRFHTTIRQLRPLQGSMEIRYNKDKILFTFQEPVAALEFAISIQERLVNTPWPDAGDLAPYVKPRYWRNQLVSNGPRVSIILHWCRIRAAKNIFNANRNFYVGRELDDVMQLIHFGRRTNFLGCGGGIVLSELLYAHAAFTASVAKNLLLEPVGIMRSLCKSGTTIGVFKGTPKSLIGRLMLDIVDRYFFPYTVSGGGGLLKRIGSTSIIPAAGSFSGRAGSLGSPQLSIAPSSEDPLSWIHHLAPKELRQYKELLLHQAWESILELSHTATGQLPRETLPSYLLISSLETISSVSTQSMATRSFFEHAKRENPTQRLLQQASRRYRDAPCARRRELLEQLEKVSLAEHDAFLPSTSSPCTVALSKLDLYDLFAGFDSDVQGAVQGAIQGAAGAQMGSPLQASLTPRNAQGFDAPPGSGSGLPRGATIGVIAPQDAGSATFDPERLYFQKREAKVTEEIMYAHRAVEEYFTMLKQYLNPLVDESVRTLEDDDFIIAFMQYLRKIKTVSGLDSFEADGSASGESGGPKAKIGEQWRLLTADAVAISAHDSISFDAVKLCRSMVAHCCRHFLFARTLVRRVQRREKALQEQLETAGTTGASRFANIAKQTLKVTRDTAKAKIEEASFSPVGSTPNSSGLLKAKKSTVRFQ